MRSELLLAVPTPPIAGIGAFNASLNLINFAKENNDRLLLYPGVAASGLEGVTHLAFFAAFDHVLLCHLDHYGQDASPPAGYLLPPGVAESSGPWVCVSHLLIAHADDLVLQNGTGLAAFFAANPAGHALAVWHPETLDRYDPL